MLFSPLQNNMMTTSLVALQSLDNNWLGVIMILLILLILIMIIIFEIRLRTLRTEGKRNFNKVDDEVQRYQKENKGNYLQIKSQIDYMHVENERNAKSITELTSSLLELVSISQKRISMEDTLHSNKKITNKEFTDFYDDLLETYKSLGGKGYVPIELIRNKLKKYKNFGELFSEIRYINPEFIRLETDNQGQTLVKLQEQ